jgi:hypothetical protein
VVEHLTSNPKIEGFESFLSHEHSTSLKNIPRRKTSESVMKKKRFYKLGAWWGWGFVLILAVMLLVRSICFSLNFTISILTGFLYNKLECFIKKRS